MSEARNAAVIRSAFARLQSNKERIIEDGMKRLAQAGLEFLIRAHDEHDLFMNHPNEDNTMAWAVGHNGSVVASGSHNGGEDDLPGSALQAAESIISNTSGWVAIILSDMEGWYSVGLEEDFLFTASFDIADTFHTYFKKIS